MENVENTSDPINASARPPQPENEREKRNKNLDILKAYIQRQRALLERIKRDVECLQTSKLTVAEDPSGALSRILQPDANGNTDKRGETYLSDGGGIGKLSELARDGLEVGGATITKEINWEVFKDHDLTPLHSLPSWSRVVSSPSLVHQHMPPPPPPSTPSLVTPRSSLSSFVFLNSNYDRSVKRKESVFQTRVREMRVKAVDPALTIAAQFLASLPPSDSDDDAAKQTRAKESRDAKEARAREAKEARNIKPQNGQSAANARSAGHVVKKSAHRRKSEASAVAAASRPRGQGGRFRKKEQAQNQNESLAPQARAAGASGSTASVTSSFLPNPDPSAQRSRLASTTPSVEDFPVDGGSRPQRLRKPSIRFGSVAPSVSSTRSGSNISATGNGKAPVGARLPSSSPIAPNGHTRGRLTIRIPARSLAKEVPEYLDRQTSASTSMTGSTSVGTSESASTDMTVSAEHGHVTLGGKCCGGWPIDGDIVPAERELASSNSAMMRSAQQSDFLDVKQEEEEHGNGMDVDEMADWDVMEEQNARFKQETVPHQTTSGTEDVPPIHYGTVDPGEDDPGNDSDDSFVCEMLPPLPGSSASSSSVSANRGVSNGARNGSANGKADAGRYSARRGNPSSKTFNMTWSDEEQRLLDMLLVQFPDGTKNRWANISRAMGGSRTPRQVASRVQKYFAKMKKWGIDVG